MEGSARVFGFSLGKLLFTVLVIVVVWKGFGLVNRLARERQDTLARRRREQPARRRARSGATVELVQCRRCGAYFDPDEGCRCQGGAG